MPRAVPAETPTNRATTAGVRWLLVLALLVAGLGFAQVGPATAAMPPNSPLFGSQFHGTWADYTDQSRAAVLDALAANGATSVRIDVSWRMLEPVQAGKFDAWGLSLVDHVIMMANERGLTPMIMFWQTPEWATGSDDPRIAPQTPAALAALTDVTRRLASRYGTQVVGWEVWNEPNHNDFLRGADPTVYAQVLRAAYAGFKSGSSTTPVVFGGLQYVDDEWASAALAAGAAGHYDVMGVHPYMGVADEAPDLPDDGTMWRMNHLPALIAAMGKHGESSKPIWFTEFGWRVAPTAPGTANWLRGVTQETQADYLMRALAMVGDRYPTVQRMYWYNDRAKSDDPANTGYGLVYSDGTPVPALAALAPAPVDSGDSTGSVFISTTPTRTYDSRWSATSGVPVGRLSSGGVRTVSVVDGRAAASGTITTPALVPVTATAVVYNITVDSGSGSGWLRVSPSGTVGSGSAVNWTGPNQQLGNGLMVSLGTSRAIDVVAGGGGSTDFIIDVVGYYVPQESLPGEGGLLTPISPARAYDSRLAGSGGILSAGGNRTIELAAAAGLPPSTSAVAYNVTVIGGSGAGHLSVRPGNAPPAGTSNVNWAGPGAVVANGSVVGVDELGRLTVQAGPSSVHFVIDVVGYFAPEVAGLAGAHFHPTSPTRVYDSRAKLPAFGLLPGWSPRAVSVRSGRDDSGAIIAEGIVPVGAKALAFNATITETVEAGYLTVAPGDTPTSSMTHTSTSNWSSTGTTIANGSIVGIDDAGQVKLFAGVSATHVVMDVVGYYE